MLRPNTLEIIRGIQASLLTHVAPEVQSPYTRAQVQYALGLLQMLTEEWDAMPQRLIEENAGLRGLFRKAAGALESIRGAGVPDGLVDRLAAAGRSVDDDLTISVLSARNQELQALLVELMDAMDAVDAAPSPTGRTALQDLRPEVHRQLRAYVERRPSRLPSG